MASGGIARFEVRKNKICSREDAKTRSRKKSLMPWAKLAHFTLRVFASLREQMFFCPYGLFRDDGRLPSD